MSKNTLQALDPVHRRRAAFMTLSEVFKDEQLMDAMWMIEEKDHSANKYTFIGFVGITTELLGINSHIVTSLYRKLNRNLDLKDQELADDPMPQMLDYQDMNQTDKTVEKKSVTPKRLTTNSPIETKGTPAMTVFVALISNIASKAEFPQNENYPLFNLTLKDEIVSATVDTVSRDQLVSWADTLNLNDFKKNIQVEELSTLVHCLYIALCKAFGIDKANKIMRDAIKLTSKIEAAKSFPPKNFLK
jgi:hypothetical protein